VMALLDRLTAKACCSDHASARLPCSIKRFAEPAAGRARALPCVAALIFELAGRGGVQDFIAAGQFRGGEQLIDRNR
jgi:hypothetical protein